MVCGFNPMEGLWILAQLFEKSRGWFWVLTMNGLRHIRSGITNKHVVNFWKKHVILFSQEEFARECIPWREYLDVAICKCYWLTFKSELLGGKEIDARTWKNCSSALDVLLYRCIPTVMDICMIMIDYECIYIYTYRLFDDIWCIVKYGSIYIFSVYIHAHTHTHTHTHIYCVYIYICIHVHIFLHKLISIYCTHTHTKYFSLVVLSSRRWPLWPRAWKAPAIWCIGRTRSRTTLHDAARCCTALNLLCKLLCRLHILSM